MSSRSAIAVIAVTTSGCGGEAELGDEPGRAHHPQRVVAEGDAGRDRGADDAGREVVDAAEVVDELAGRQPHGHRVDGEVAAGQVALERVAEAHLRLARRRVVLVGAVRGDLDVRARPGASRSCRTRGRRPTRRRSSRRSTASICSGRASVVRSQSWPTRPISASRTGPPTMASSCPASANRRPRSASAGSEPISRSSRARCSVVGAEVDTTTHSTIGPAECPCIPAARYDERVGSRRRAVVRAVVATLLLPLRLARRRRPARRTTPTSTSGSPAQRRATSRTRSAVTMTGTVTNNDDHAWTDAQAYLVIPATPFTTRTQVDDAIDTGNAYTGERVVDLKSIDEIGDLRPGATDPFRGPGSVQAARHHRRRGRLPGGRPDSRYRHRRNPGHHRDRAGHHVPAAGVGLHSGRRSPPASCGRSSCPTAASPMATTPTPRR